MTQQIEGRFSVISGRLARQASERFAGATGWLVLDQTGRVIYQMKGKADAIEACNRLNVLDRAA